LLYVWGTIVLLLRGSRQPTPPQTTHSQKYTYTRPSPLSTNQNPTKTKHQTHTADDNLALTPYNSGSVLGKGIGAVGQGVGMIGTGAL
jgi:hypothetical protein